MDTKQLLPEGMEAWMPAVIAASAPAEPAQGRLARLDAVLVEHPDWADLRIADFVPCSQSTVKTHRAALERDGTIQPAPIRSRRDGTTQRANFRTVPVENSGERFEIIEAPVLAEDAKEACRALQVWSGPDPVSNPAIKYVRKKCKSVGAKNNARAAMEIVAKAMGFHWDTLPWHKATYAAYEGFMVLLKESGIKQSTAAQYLTHLRGVMEQGFLSRQISADDWMRIKDEKLDMQKEEKDLAREVPIEEWVKIVDSFDFEHGSDLQDLAMLVGLFPLGCRQADVAMMQPENLDTEFPLIKIFRPKTVNSTPTKTTLLLDDFPATLEVLRTWWASRPEGKDASWYHCSAGWKSKINWGSPVGQDPKHIKNSAKTVGDRARLRAKRAGVKNFSSKCGRIAFENIAAGANVPPQFLNAQSGRSQMNLGSRGAYIRENLESRRHAFKGIPEFERMEAALWAALERHALRVGSPSCGWGDGAQRLGAMPSASKSHGRTRLCANPRCPRGTAGRPAVFTPARVDQVYCVPACRSMVSKDKGRSNA